VAAILALAIGLRGLREKPVTQVAQAPAPPKVAQNVAPPETRTPAPAREAPAPPPPPAPAKQKAAEPAPEEAAPAPVPEKKAKPKIAKRAESSPAPAASGPPGIVALAVSPWGEIIVDGKNLGVSPPLQELRLSPGRHRIEIRNTSFTPHVQIVQVKSGEQIRIRHRFQ
jgi:hypothetical protein